MKEKFRNEEELKRTLPPGGHRERFIQRLEQEDAKGGKIKWMPWVLSLAAAAALAWGVFTFGGDSSGEEKHITHYNSFEKLNERTDKLEGIYASFVKPQLPAIAAERPELSTQIALLEKLEEEYSKLKTLLSQSGDKRITQEMIRNHRTRLKIMDQLLMQLEIMNINKSRNNENNSI